MKVLFSIFKFVAIMALVSGCGSLKVKKDRETIDGEIVQKQDLFPEAPEESEEDAAEDVVSTETPDAPAAVATEEVAKEDEEDSTLTSKLDESKIALKDYPGIPHHYNRHVQKWLDYFQGRGEKHMRRYLERSTKYLPLMKKILRENGMPEDLVYISLIESGFGTSARSHAGAVGYWQFISATGKRYGMQINSLVDERKDPIKSTHAAVRYFRSLYNVFGNWYFAFAAYNGGENRMFRVLMKQESRDFWTIAEKRMLPAETVNYIPKYLAARMIAKEPAKYGFTDLDFSDEYDYAEVVASQTVDLSKLSSEMGMDYEELKSLNGQFNTQYAPVFDGKTISIRVPSKYVEKATVAMNNAYVTDTRMIAAVKSKEYYRYKVRRGDTLSRIAKRHNTSISKIRELNSLNSRATIQIGQSLRVPENTNTKKLIQELRRSLKETRTAKKGNRSYKKPDFKKGYYIVRRGDTLLNIARKHNVSLSKILASNKIKNSSKLFVGKRLVIPE